MERGGVKMRKGEEGEGIYSMMAQIQMDTTKYEGEDVTIQEIFMVHTVFHDRIPF